MVLETEEESGSQNLLNLLSLAKDAIGTPDMVFCMDSGAFDYESLWLTSSLRGVIEASYNIEAGMQGYHSGELGGILPETFRVWRDLLDRVDDVKTGRCAAEFETQIPNWAHEEAKMMAELSGDTMYKKYRIHEGVKCLNQDDLPELYLNNTWRPCLAIVGADGIPSVAAGGNVCRANTSLKLSMRIAPNANAKKCLDALNKKMTENVPYNCKVTPGDDLDAGQGWCMKDMPEWLKDAVSEAGKLFYDGN